MKPYVQRVLDRLQGVRPTEKGWLAHCPGALHSDKGTDRRPSLVVDLGREGRILLKCRTGCSTASVLDALDLGWGALFCPKGEEPMIEQVSLLSRPPPSMNESPEVRHSRYERNLREWALDYVSASQLQRRGLSPEERDLRGYRTVMFPDINDTQVTQNYANTSWKMTRGTIVPVRDAYGRVIALKVRKDGESQPKYFYWEAGCGNPPHVALFRHLLYDPCVVRVTEGELKADVATALTGMLTIGCPGVANWGRLFEPLALIRPKLVHVAFDWPDVCKKPAVMQQTRACVRQLIVEGYAVKVEHWEETQHKGVDDLLAAGHRPLVSDGAQFLELTLRNVTC